MAKPDQYLAEETPGFGEIITSLQVTLQQMARWGCKGFECPEETLAVMQRWGASRRTEKPAPDQVPPTTDHQPAVTETLEQIRDDLGDCRRCNLATGRTHIVYGEGNPRARLVFVGEGPGQEEDRSGRPFVGAAGQLLTKIIGAMKLTREEVYICNIIKCRPPGNRDPLPDEIASCRPYLMRQLASINPEAVCTLGKHAARALLNTDAPISSIRGRFQSLGSLKVMPTYHPAYLLRNPDRKREVWEDMKKIMALLRIPL